jgi:hypothetical protein
MFSCGNEDITFPDYDRQTIYMPYQYPVRTLSLGNDRIDNSLDRQHKFNIGVVVGGYYNTNKRDWRVDFAVDESLVPDNLYRGDNKIEALPATHYTLTPESQMVIPRGSFSGLIEVQLTDAFFADPRALTGAWVIPVKITGSPDTEHIIWGTPQEGMEEIADLHKAEDWSVQPMYFSLFGVKYLNPWHGSWLRSGRLIVRDDLGAVIESECVDYTTEFVEKGDAVKFTTSSMNSVTADTGVGAERWKMSLTVDTETNRIVVSSVSGIGVYGTGSYKINGESWGGTPEQPTPRDAVYLNYFYERDNGQRCEVLETFVLRDRGIVFEASRPTIK